MSDLEPPEDFGFPFAPYDIQVDFMKALFITLEKKKLGIFESPTGTVESFVFINLLWNFISECKENLA